jgi:methylphosphotriester-DNA--protein-cysteine methyltransferase
MSLNADICYEALRSNDARFDGVFFVGIATTGIYCRAVCTARTPLRKNCTFYPSAAAAERAGYRPCLRCRPELAPGNARIDAVSRLAAVAAGRIEDGALTDRSLEELAGEMGVSDRHLRRVIQSEFGVSPVELAQTQRLLLAKRLLTDTSLPVTEVAFASGFNSLRRFNALFRERYHLNPTELRKARTSVMNSETLVCEVAYRPPFDWDSLRAFARLVRSGDRRRQSLSADGRARWEAGLDRGRALPGEVCVAGRTGGVSGSRAGSDSGACEAAFRSGRPSAADRGASRFAGGCPSWTARSGGL